MSVGASTINFLTAGKEFDTNAAAKNITPSVKTIFQRLERPGERYNPIVLGREGGLSG